MATMVNLGTQQFFGFDPRTIPGCQLWLDGADPAVLFTDSAGTIPVGSSGNIGRWTDKSGSGRHYIQATSAARPSFANNTVTWSATSQVLASTVALGISGIDIFVVVKPLPAAGASFRTLFRGGVTDHPILIESGTTRLGYFVNGGSGFNQFGALTVDGSARALLYVSIPPTRTATAALNGTVALSSGANPMAATGDFQSLGNSGVGGAQPWGDVSEVILISNTTAPQRQLVEGYLAWKWGLAATLPVSGHAYRSLIPSMRIFQPRDIANCALWFDAADTSTITGTSPVTAWRSKGTLASITAVNAVGTCTSGSTVNGLNFVRCPAGTSLRFTAALNTQARSWFFVSRLNTALISGTFAGIVNQLGVTGQDSVVASFVNATTNQIGMGPSGIAANVLMNIPATTMASVYMGSLVNSVTLSLNRGTVNGAVQTLTATRSASSFNTASQIYEIGTSRYTTSVDIMEVLFYYGDVSESQRLYVQGYLARKWGLLGLVPATHPFLDVLPSTPSAT